MGVFVVAFFLSEDEVSAWGAYGLAAARYRMWKPSGFKAAQAFWGVNRAIIIIEIVSAHVLGVTYESGQTKPKCGRSPCERQFPDLVDLQGIVKAHANRAHDCERG